MAIYKVKKNDYLIKIGHELGIEWHEIAKLNNLHAPYTIYTGQSLKIPDSKEVSKQVSGDASNLTFNGKDDFINRMTPFARFCESKTSVPYQVILSQWAWESAWGNSDLAKRSNNFAGISANSSGRDFVSGGYAGYNTIQHFANDWSRLINSNTYAGVRNAVSRGDAAVIDALDKSPWATDPNYGNGLRSTFAMVSGKNLPH